MLPHALKRAVGPSKTLLGKISQGIGSLGQPDSVLLVADPITQLSHLDREILILGKCVRRKSARLFENRSTPGTDRTGHDHYAVERCKCPPVKVLRGNIFERLPFSYDIDAVADLGITGDGADILVSKSVGQCRDRLGVKQGVGIEGYNDLTARFSPAKIQSLGLSAIWF